MIPVGFAGLVVAVSAGAIVFYNTNVENRYLTGLARRAESAHYERTYRPLIDLALPRMVSEELRVDLEPERQAFTAAGTFTYVNKQLRPVDSAIVSLFRRDGLRIDTLTLDRPTTRVVTDTLSWTRIAASGRRSLPATPSGSGTGPGSPPAASPTRARSRTLRRTARSFGAAGFRR